MRRNVLFLDILFFATLTVAAGCSNDLLDEARSLQSKAASPRIAASKSDGTALSSGGSLDFGSLSVGKTATLSLTLANSGPNDLVISSSGISLVPDSGSADGIFAFSRELPLTIASGATASLALTFTPSAAQSYGATLAIASNDVTLPSFSVRLSGSGSATAKAFTAFGIQSPAVSGTIDESARMIAITEPYGTSVTSLIATFTSTGANVLIGSTAQTSGVTVNDFTNPVTYTVVAQDGSTADYKVTVTLSFTAPIVTLASIDKTGITTTTAGGEVTIANTGGVEVAEAGVCWSSTNGTPTVSDSLYSVTSPSSAFSASLSGLSAGTTYYARAYAKNSIGYGYSSVVSFITLPATPVISSVAPVGGTAGSGQLLVSWGAAAGAAAYNVYAHTSNTFSSASVIAGGSGLSSSTTSCTLTGLTNYTTYYVWVKASNASGSATSSSSWGEVGVPVKSLTLQRSADYVTVSGGRTADTLIWDTTQSTSSIDALYAVASPSNATNTAVTWSSTGGASVTAAGVVSLSSAATGTIKATPADGQGGTVATINVSYISAAKGATNYTGPGGGKIFYDKGSYSNGWRYMEVYYNSGKGTYLSVPWGGYGTTTGATGSDIGTGKENTDTIISVLGSGGGYMAYCCRYSFANNGYSDWFLPSFLEVESVRTVLGFASYTMFYCSTEIDNVSSWCYYNNFYNDGAAVQWNHCVKNYSSCPSLPTRRF
jgi:hypothetical protein